MSVANDSASIWTARDDSGERGDTRRLAHIVALGQDAGAGDAAVLG
ncbi:formimidoylglutamase, partial [Bordetella pertussis]